jgi:hypothetical protein
MTTIHTGNTTTTGFVVNADNTGNLVIKTGGSGGTTAATFDGTSQQATFAAPVSQPGAFMFRNKIINGNFDIWQRGTSQTSSGYGSADRWQCDTGGGSTKTASRQAFDLGQTDVPNNPKYFMRHVVTSSAGASNYILMTQKVEGVETLSGKTATVSFWAKADASKNIAVEIYQDFGTGGSPSAAVLEIGSQLVALTTSWTKHTITVDIPSVSGKTLGTDGNDGLGLVFWFDAGSDFDARTASLGQQSGTFDIAQVQLEEGSAATPFEQRPYGMELSLCQRYYERINHIVTTAANGGFGNSYAAALYYSEKRVGPTITVYSGINLTGTSGSLTWYPGTTVAAASISALQKTHVSFQRTGTSTNNLMTGSVALDAEL